MSLQTCLELDDVLLIPVPSDVSSRDDVDISIELPNNTKLTFPFMASPMVGVTDGKFIKLLSKLGGLGFFHRFYDSEEELLGDIDNNMSPGDNFGISIKIGEEYIEHYLDFEPTILLVDTANGYTDKLLKYCDTIKNIMAKEGSNALLMAGNVATRAGCVNLANAGCDLIRVGIGGGSPCSTRNQTGIGIPMVTSLKDCSSTGQWMCVADGGIKNSGDFVKALVAGADLAMGAKAFAETFESPNKGVLYGMASRTHMNNQEIKIKSVEGIDIPITKKYSLEQFLREFGYGIKSAGTYLSARNLYEIYLNGEFIQVTNSAIKKGI